MPSAAEARRLCQEACVYQEPIADTNCEASFVASVSGTTNNSFEFPHSSLQLFTLFPSFDSEDKPTPVKVALRDITPDSCFKFKVTVSTIDVTYKFALTFFSLLSSTFSYLL